MILIGALLANALLFVPAFAGFGFGSDDNSGKSGLDMNRGYDINTVTTVTGKAVSPPHRIEKEHMVIEVKSLDETINVCVGPSSFWEAKGIPVAANDELAAKGSMAQGQDGKKYLIAQKLVNKSTGASLEFRSESGMPSWSGRDMNRSGRSEGGMRSRGGMMRGGGMMRR